MAISAITLVMSSRSSPCEHDTATGKIVTSRRQHGDAIPKAWQKHCCYCTDTPSLGRPSAHFQLSDETVPHSIDNLFAGGFLRLVLQRALGVARQVLQLILALLSRLVLAGVGIMLGIAG